jgi:hypothetical protein
MGLRDQPLLLALAAPRVLVKGVFFANDAELLLPRLDKVGGAQMKGYPSMEKGKTGASATGLDQPV